MQVTQVGSLVREDPTWHEATKPVYHKYYARAREATATTAEAQAR